MPTFSTLHEDLRSRRTKPARAEAHNVIAG